MIILILLRGYKRSRATLDLRASPRLKPVCCIPEASKQNLRGPRDGISFSPARRARRASFLSAVGKIIAATSAWIVELRSVD